MNAALINSYREAEDYFFRGISFKCLDLDCGATAYMTGGAGLNLIYIARVTNGIDKILIKGKQFYDQDDLSFDVIIPQEWCDSQVVSILNSMDYEQQEKSVSMIVNLDEFAIDRTSSFDSETVIKANDDKLSDWIVPLAGAFESTFETCSIYAGRHEIALKNNVNLSHYSLYKQGKPIASITVSLNNGIARVDDVGTLPEFQGKGYATHLVHYVLSKAKTLGAKYSFLESSSHGVGVYEKLGFEPLFENNIYSKRFKEK
ncbi:GNAT family N-acetyltransferase [Chromobacterium alticapitis]|uniref:N-acetyltransferase n=1 Tax=Chromobacterium alticapitis TaxID=2073169 RepID=A0A2S5DA89_9NEIS|nr:GNAT family N-acetyltransferase [Chromobacterium alticapitis]POZ59996.1 N-acetyltransferase [Chromobacterium alticapitis]